MIVEMTGDVIAGKGVATSEDELLMPPYAAAVTAKLYHMAYDDVMRE